MLLQLSASRDDTQLAIKRINVNELYHFGMCLVREAGKKIVEIRLKNDLNAHKKQIDKSVVTEADLVSHQIIVHTLKSKFSSLNVISEENEAQKSIPVDISMYKQKCDTYEKTPNDFYYTTDFLTVWVDPLDATQEYTENLVEYVTIMLCIVVNGLPKSGIIHKPFTNHTDWSWITHENSISNINTTKPVSKSSDYPHRIVVSRSHTGKVKSYIEENLKNTKIIEAAGSGYKVLYVANDSADLYLHTSSIRKWDLCAPNAIITSLNGKLTDIDGNLIDYSHQTDTHNVHGVIASVKNFDFYLKTFASKQV